MSPPTEQTFDGRMPDDRDFDEEAFETALADLIHRAESADVDLAVARDVDRTTADGCWMVEISRVADSRSEN